MSRVHLAAPCFETVNICSGALVPVVPILCCVVGVLSKLSNTRILVSKHTWKVECAPLCSLQTQWTCSRQGGLGVKACGLAAPEPWTPAPYRGEGVLVSTRSFLGTCAFCLLLRAPCSLLHLLRSLCLPLADIITIHQPSCSDSNFTSSPPFVLCPWHAECLLTSVHAFSSLLSSHSSHFGSHVKFLGCTGSLTVSATTLSSPWAFLHVLNFPDSTHQLD